MTGPRTAWWKLSGDPAADEPVIRRAAEVLRRGGLVAFPTETVYGLGADAFNAAAVRRIFAAKGRPADNPLIVHIASPDGITPELVSEWPPAAAALARAFWPGPLTLVVRAGHRVPAVVTAGLPTVAVRCPAHDVARALIEASGRPVAAPSANRSGRPSATRAEDVWEDLAGRIDVLLDAGPAPVGVESTVVDVSGPRPRLLRPGGVPLEDLEAVLGEPVEGATDLAPGEPPPSPGMKYRHYAPRAPLELVPSGGDRWQAAAAALRRAVAAGGRVAIIGCREDLARVAEVTGIPLIPHDPAPGDEYGPAGQRRPSSGEPGAATPGARSGGAGDVVAFDLGSRDDPAEQARRLFRALRAADAAGATRILALAVPERGLGRTVMNRLRKAASGGEIGAGTTGVDRL